MEIPSIHRNGQRKPQQKRVFERVCGSVVDLLVYSGRKVLGASSLREVGIGEVGRGVYVGKEAVEVDEVS